MPKIPHNQGATDWGKFWAMVFEFDLDEWVDWMGEKGISRALFLCVIYVALLFVLNLQIPNLFMFAFGWVVGLAPIWLPIALIIGYYHIWIWYARSKFLFGREPVLYEMKIPRDIMKSPRAMETALTAFWYFQGETTFFLRFLKGQVRPFYSLEMASFGGQVHFYIWVWKAWAKAIESHMYSQYPEIELHQVEDYAQKFVYDPDIHQCYCTDWRLEPASTKKRYADAYPIKTYIDFELQDDPKEEFKVEPLATVIEFLGSLKPSEQMWIQIIIRCHHLSDGGPLSQTSSSWKKQVEAEIEKVRLESAIFPADITSHATPQQLAVARPRATWTQTYQIEAMGRNLGKLPFEVGMRGIYISTPKDFSTGSFWSMRWIWRPFANPQYMSQLRPRRGHNGFDFPWQDFHDIRWDLVTTRNIDAYRRRSFFHTPWETPINIMSTEVLATLFHPPSATVKTPGLQRISATKAAPPPNLPK